jgi:chloramphenicol 3-O-phosphotransferase
MINHPAMVLNTNPPGRLVILAGPSCVGKSPLASALARLRGEPAQTEQWTTETLA